MKGIYGLCVAIALGIAGALFNFAYLSNVAAKSNSISFIGIKKGAVVNRGEPLQADHITRVDIPKDVVGNLDGFAVRWTAQQAVINLPVWRTLAGPRLLLEEDTKPTATEQLSLGKGERAMFINVDTRSFVPTLVVPGDMVSFLLPRLAAGVPTPAIRPGGPGSGVQGTPPGGPTAEGEEDAAAAKPTAFGDAIGPFKVLALGNRLSSSETMRAAKLPQVQENVITIRVNNNDKAEVKRAADLWKVMQTLDFRPLGVRLDEQGSQQR